MDWYSILLKYGVPVPDKSEFMRIEESPVL